MFAVSCLIVLIDQSLKYIVLHTNSSHVLNRGFSFGVGAGIGAWVLLALLSIVILDSVKRGLRLPDMLIISGGFSNMLDRFFHGGVTDWIRVNSLWFNIADISITAGVLWICLNAKNASRRRVSGSTPS